MIRIRLSAPPPRHAVAGPLLSAIALVGCGEGGDPASMPAPADTSSSPVAVVAPAAPAAALERAPPVPLRAGLNGYADPDGRYADAARAASLGYAGRVEPAALDADVAGTFLAAVLHGPMSAGLLPGGLPFEGSHRGDEGALFPGYPVALLSRTGLGFPQAEPRSLGTRMFEARAAFENAKSHQKPWWTVFDDASAGQLRCGGGGTVTWSSNLLADAPSAAGDERSVTWDACVVPSDSGMGWNAVEISEGITLDGAARLHRADAPDGFDHRLAWDGLEYAGNGGRWRLTGVESSPGADGCGFDRRRRTHLLVEPLDGGDAVLLENFETGVLGDPPSSESCRASGLFQNWFGGRLLHARHGAVEVSTPAHLAFLSMSKIVGRTVANLARDPVDPTRETRGELVLRGGADSEVRLRPETFRRFGGAYADEYEEPETEAWRIDVQPADRAPFTLRVPVRYGFRGVLADLGDADSDGMPNVWERIVGLDPTDPADGGDDADDDGLAAREEFANLTHPLSKDVAAPETDTAIRALDVDPASSDYVPDRVRRSGFDRFVASESRPASLVVVEGVSLGRRNLERRHYPVTLEIEGAGFFPHATSFNPFQGGAERPCAFAATDYRRIDCTWRQDQWCSMNGCNAQGLGMHAVWVVRAGPGPVTVTARLKRGAADPDASNDVAHVRLDAP